jgi:hypothetical protein
LKDLSRSAFAVDVQRQKDLDRLDRCRLEIEWMSFLLSREAVLQILLDHIYSPAREASDLEDEPVRTSHVDTSGLLHVHVNACVIFRMVSTSDCPGIPKAKSSTA